MDVVEICCCYDCGGYTGTHTDNHTDKHGRYEWGWSIGERDFSE
jgi:hypothetical protein